MIQIEDVLTVADNLGLSLTIGQVKEVLEMYPFEEKLDPTATWDLITENCIYNVLNDEL